MAGKKIRLLLLFFKLLVDNRHQSHMALTDTKQESEYTLADQFISLL